MLHAWKYFPFSRMQELFNDVFDTDISEGRIHYLLNSFADEVIPVYELIRERVSASLVVGSDETGAKVNNQKNWFWTWQIDTLTFIPYLDNRGSDTINTNFPEGFSNSTLVHDGWRAQFKTAVEYHQSCIAHLQRSLKYLNQLYPTSNWGKDFIKLLYDSLVLKKNYTF